MSEHHLSTHPYRIQENRLTFKECEPVFFEFSLLLNLLVRILLAAPVAELLELDFALDELLVLAGPVIDALTLGAGKFDESILGHMSSVI